MSTKEPEAWVPPEGAVCIEQDCDLPPVGSRPSRSEYVLEDDEGRERIIPAGGVDEMVCENHLEEEGS